MKIQFKIWLEKDKRVLFGEGRNQLLQAIEDYGSLAQAAKKMNMSYRAAWGRLKASEERMGMKLVDVDSTEKGMHLTPLAQAIIDRFEKLERDVNDLLAEAGRDFRLLIREKKNRES